MARPMRDDPHLRIAHELTEQIMVRRFSLKERRTLDFILRLSWGCGKEWAFMPHAADLQCVGIYKQDAPLILRTLRAENVIYWDEDTGHAAFNKDYDSWRVSLEPAALATRQRFQDLLRANLSPSCPQPAADFLARVALHDQPTPTLTSHSGEAEHETPQAETPQAETPPAAEATPASNPQTDTDPALARAASLYADNIGHLTPIIADQLRDLSAQYPEQWLVTAITEAARHEKRSLAYVTAILERWHREGFQAPGQKGSPSPRGRQPHTQPPSAADLQSAWNPQATRERSAP